jgi:hypothetical protein
MQAASCVGASLLQPVCQGIGGIGSSIFGTGASAALDALSAWVADGSAWLLGQIGAALGATTKISLGAPWFVTRYRSMEGLLAVLALPLLVASAIQALIRQRASVLLRAAFVQLPLAMVLAGVAVELVTMALAVTDQLSAAVSSGTPGALGSLTGSIARVLLDSTTSTGSAMPTFVAMLCAALVAIAALTLWVELVLRAAAIYVVVLFLPLALACSIWPALIGWCRRLVETLVALIASKLVVVVVLEAAVGALGTQSGRGFATIVTGIALLILATMAPFTLLKLLPLFESSAMLHLEGMRQRGTAAFTRGAPRQAASAALDRLSAAPLAVPAAIGVLAGAGARGDHGQLGEVGHRTSEDPMSASAIPAADVPSGTRGTPPTVSASEPGDSGSDTVARDAGRRGSSPPQLVIERDELGPIIRMRGSSPQAADDGR